jgi:hypothetical protein
MKAIYILLKDATTTQTSQAVSINPSGPQTVQATIAGTGAVSATVEIYGSNTPTFSDALLLATCSLSGTTTDKTGAVIEAQWLYMWGKVTAISGTSATVNVTVGV